MSDKEKGEISLTTTVNAPVKTENVHQLSNFSNKKNSFLEVIFQNAGALF